MNDFELFKAMNKAEKKYDALRNEFRRRGLHKKPYCEFSRFKFVAEKRAVHKV
jgi:hypothetical protein